tara:strand:- start:1102 stop:1752 length:651 start_codon:yes stop_codon:yes gene_type:complete
MKKLINRHIKAILFDMDGVVVDSEKLYSQSENKLLNQYGVKFSDADWLQIKGCTEKQFYDLIYSKFDISISRNQLMIKGREFLKEIFTQKLNYMNGFLKLHTIIKKKYKLALVTSTGKELVQHINQILSIENKFDLIITSHDTDLHKPNPKPYLMAMENFKLNANQCIVIEDSIQGIKAGQAAGCKVIALEGSLEKKFLKDADHIIENLLDILNNC